MRETGDGEEKREKGGRIMKEKPVIPLYIPCTEPVRLA